MAPVTLVLGGARSGKSRHAERLVRESGRARLYIATGRAWDDEMRQRIKQHQRDRGPEWRTIEAPEALEDAIDENGDPKLAVIVDCLTLWVTNLMMADEDVAERSRRLVSAVRASSATIVLVSNEVGLGIVPENAMARAFRDHAGRLHQLIAEAADNVHFVAAGLALTLKGTEC